MKQTASLYLKLPLKPAFFNVLDKNLIYPKVQGQGHGQIKTILKSSHFTEYVQYRVFRQMQQQIYKFLLSPFLLTT